MPYVSQATRHHLKYDFTKPVSKGELTYLICVLLKGYRAENYQQHSDVVAACADAAHEYRRRVLDPYEDRKREENGDVW